MRAWLITVALLAAGSVACSTHPGCMTASDCPGYAEDPRYAGGQNRVCYQHECYMLCATQGDCMNNGTCAPETSVVSGDSVCQ